jgi:hypothetical protein
MASGCGGFALTTSVCEYKCSNPMNSGVVGVENKIVKGRAARVRRMENQFQIAGGESFINPRASAIARFPKMCSKMKQMAPQYRISGRGLEEERENSCLSLLRY